MIKIKTALLSVYDKTGILELAEFLATNNVEILSSGGTAKYLIKNGIEVTEVSDYTGSPELFDGRVKTLHPKIHAGILARGEKDQKELEEFGAKKIDLVVVNLYPFTMAAKAKPIPVFPDVPSTIVPPGFNLPSDSASSTIFKAILSFTELPGLKYSTLASTVASISLVILFNLTIGVFPIVSRILLAIFIHFIFCKCRK